LENILSPWRLPICSTIVISLFLLLFSSWQIALSAPSSPRDNPDFWDKLSSVVLIDPTWTIPPPAEPFSFPQTVTDLVSILGDLPLGPNVLCNQDDTSQAQNEPSIDVNPFDPNHVIATSNDYRLRVGPPPENDVRAGYYASFDGGNTWPGDGIIDISTIPNTFAAGDPSIAIHDIHNVYYSYIAFNRSTDDGGVAVSKSTDGGLTWQDPVVVAWNSASIFRDKDYMAVDATGSPYDGNVYVTWTNFAYGTPIYFSRSTDGGATFSSPFRISDSEYDSNQGSLPVVGPDGVLYVAWLNYYPSSIRMVKSTNGGSSFGTPFEVAAVDEIPSPLPGGDFRDNSFPTMAIDPNNGNIYVAWSDYRNGDADIYFTRSTNDGSTWSTPIRINDDPLGNDAHQFFPWMDVAPNGKLYLSWFDSRNDPTPLVSPLLYDEYAAASTDGGLTFSLNQRISEVTSDSSIGGFTTPFIGDYSGLAVTNDFIFPAWVDTRRDQEDIYTQRTENVQGHKSAPEWVDPLASFSYSIVIQSTSDISANQVDDPIPEGALYVLTSAWASSGLVDYSGGIVTWNGDISSGVPITITFDVTPTASACLSITNSALLTTGQGLSLTMEATSIITGSVPSPEFSWSSSELVFTFTNETSATTPTDYLWDFGDGITSTETSPVHEYTLPGDYLVTLLAANLCGSAEISHAINAACSAPQAAFTWLADELTITFTNQTSGHFPLNFLWDFGDAITGTLESPVHDYSYAGTFDVTLYATDFCGIGSLTQPVTTTCTDTSAFFTWQADGLLVSFTNGSSGTLPLEYVWDFGDGTTSAERSPSHQYTIPGRYDVLLTVSGPCGVAEYQAIVGAGRFIFMPLAVKH
jgi:PKD repeat protein